MVINILANAGVLMVAIYIYFKIYDSTTYYKVRSNWEHIVYTTCVSVVGLILMNFSIVVSGLRYDFRGLLFALSICYFGWKTTLPSIMILTCFRFLWGDPLVAKVNVILSFYMMLTLPLLMNYLKERLSNFAQLAILLANNLLMTAVGTFLLLEDRFLSAQIILLYIAINYLLLFLSDLIIEDFRSMVSKINQDCLTNLNNQRRFHDDLQILNDLNDNITIALLDIDYFKKYNDNFGHDVGDLILKSVSDVMQKHTSPNVNFYRVGGEEFAMVMVGYSQMVAESKIKALHQAVSGTNIKKIADSVLISPTVSIGVAHVEQGETLEMAYKRADIALYQSKNNGRNQVQIANYAIN